MGDVTVKETYDNLLRQLKERYGFEASGWDEIKRRISFTRENKNYDGTDTVELHDDRNNKNVGDWQIHSYSVDFFDNWGYGVSDLGEYKLFARIIKCLEELYPLTVMEKKGEK